jgi:hypothetical protein
MKADFAAKLQSAMRGGITAKTGVAGVTGVAGDPATCAKSLTLQWLRPLRQKIDTVANDTGMLVSMLLFDNTSFEPAFGDDRVASAASHRRRATWFAGSRKLAASRGCDFSTVPGLTRWYYRMNP